MGFGASYERAGENAAAESEETADLNCRVGSQAARNVLEESCSAPRMRRISELFSRYATHAPCVQKRGA